MPRLGESRDELLESLGRHYGPLPSTSGDPSAPFESIVRAALGLVADPKTASAAFDALSGAGFIEPDALAGADPLELDDVFQQARIRLASKALNPLRKVARWASERSRDFDSFERPSTEAIREDWRALNGVGPATADALLLFGLGRPTYPVDRASYRILVRHGWLDPSSDYDEARSVLESIAPDDPSGLTQLALGFEKLGRQFCKAGAPKCEQCPLRRLLPDGGPLMDEA